MHRSCAAKDAVQDDKSLEAQKAPQYDKVFLWNHRRIYFGQGIGR